MGEEAPGGVELRKGVVTWLEAEGRVDWMKQVEGYRISSIMGWLLWVISRVWRNDEI